MYNLSLPHNPPFSRTPNYRARDAQRAQKREATLAAYPPLGGMIKAVLEDAVHATNTFAHDIVTRVLTYGTLTEKQFAALARSLERDREFAAEAKARGPVPRGRQKLTGAILSLKWKTSPRYGESLKMTVALPNGARVWGTAPSGVGALTETGTTLTFVATVEPSPTDPTFGFFKRPKLTCIQEAPQRAHTTA